MQPSDGLLKKIKTVAYSRRDQGTLIAEQQMPSAKRTRKIRPGAGSENIPLAGSWIMLVTSF
jgi:hypothetical protein